MRKVLLVIFATSVLAFVSTAALAADITPKIYTKTGSSADFSYYSNGIDRGYDFNGFTTSTYLYGTWNNPYRAGIDAYNYNDAQGYAGLGQGGVLFIWGESMLPILQGMGYTTQQAAMYFPYSIPAGTKFSYIDPNGIFQNVGQGPHGGYATSTHKCRDCHAVHRASGKFKLTRADSRTEACDWCHGDGAGSGYNIQTDNDDAFTKEYNVGHTMGFGTSDGKYKAPDDTYPAYTPKYYMGGFSCFDCHSPHGNPQRLLGYMDMGRMMNPQATFPFPRGDNGQSIFYQTGMQMSGFISNPGVNNDNTEMMRVPWPLNDRHSDYETSMTLPFPDGSGGIVYMEVRVFNVWQAVADNVPWLARRPIVTGGRYLLIENPDDQEPVPDYSTATVSFPGGGSYVVNKVKTSWDFPYGTVSEDDLLGDSASNFINPLCAAVTIAQFCTDCHDGNAGLHTLQVPLFSEDRAARGEVGAAAYDIGYGHDVNPRHCGRQMKFNPEDANEVAGTGNFGPHCRNCHKGAASCDRCHSTQFKGTTDTALAAINFEEAYPEFVQNVFSTDVASLGGYPWAWPLYGGLSAFGIPQGFPGSWLETMGYPTAGGYTTSSIAQMTAYIDEGTGSLKNERTVWWASNWRINASALTPVCSDDGFSFPHRTMGWKMLKDELFGLDFDGSEVSVGATRTALPMYIDSTGATQTWNAASLPASLYNKKAHDLDSVCLDCHNPNIWNASSYSDYWDDWKDDTDNFDDELLLRGLP